VVVPKLTQFLSQLDRLPDAYYSGLWLNEVYL
jgi:hypothetical protein